MACKKPPFAPFPNPCPFQPEINKHCQESGCLHHRYDLEDFIGDTKPKISVIIPMYNVTSKQLLRSLYSIATQTFPIHEVVAVDDGSHDMYANFYEDCFQTVLGTQEIDWYVYFQKNHGQAHARNKAFIESSGDYIAYLDAGDTWDHDHIEKSLLCMFEQNSAFVYGNFRYNIYGEVKDNQYNPQIIGHEKEALVIANPISINSVVHTDKIFIAAGGFEEGVVCGEDGVLWRRMSEILPHFAYNPDVTSTYYKISSGQSITLMPPKMLKAIHLIGGETNGQELDNQARYLERVEKLKKRKSLFIEQHKKLEYISVL